MEPRNPAGINPGHMPKNLDRDDHLFVKEVNHIIKTGNEPDALDKILMTPEAAIKMLATDLDNMTHLAASIFVLMGEKGINVYGDSLREKNIRIILERLGIEGEHMSALNKVKSDLIEVDRFLRDQISYEDYLDRVDPEVNRYEQAIKEDNNYARNSD